MSYLKQAYELGAIKAAKDFADVLSKGDDNPTSAPLPKFANQKTIDRILKDLEPDKEPKPKQPRFPISKRSPHRESGYAQLLRQKSKERKKRK